MANSYNDCPTCMKRFDGDMCVRCEREMDWEKEFDKRFVVQSWDGPTLIQGDVYQSDRVKAFIRTAIQKAIAQERERIASQIYRLYPPTFIEGSLIISGKQEATHIRRLTTDETGVLTDVLHIITNNHE